MADGSLLRASFVRTDEDGLLEFRLDDGRIVCVAPSDALERGITEARQILAQRMGTAAPKPKKVIPLKTIQTMLRAGKDVADVARELDVDEATVRRSAKAVAVDRDYQIGLFKRTVIPRMAGQHTAEEVIRTRLADKGVRISEATWNAVRQGREPWQISLTYRQDSEEHTVRWSFDTNRVITSLDKTAQELLTSDEEIARARQAALSAQNLMPSTTNRPPTVASPTSSPASSAASAGAGVTVKVPVNAPVPVSSPSARETGGRAGSQEAGDEGDGDSGGSVEEAGPAGGDAGGASGSGVSSGVGAVVSSGVPSGGAGADGGGAGVVPLSDDAVTQSLFPAIVPDGAGSASGRSPRPRYRTWDEILIGDVSPKK